MMWFLYIILLVDSKKIIIAPEIPSTVTNMDYAFCYCSNLEKAPIIPSGVTNMESTFSDCSSLIEAPVIPDSVTNMSHTFQNCNSLTTAPVIPSSVVNMNYTFRSCCSLTGDLVINANPTYYDNCLLQAADSTSESVHLYLSGKSNLLNEILKTARRLAFTGTGYEAVPNPKVTIK